MKRQVSKDGMLLLDEGNFIRGFVFAFAAYNV
jgi:hypothetical protein